MLKSFKTIRGYYKIAGVKGYLIFFEFATFLIPSILSIISPVLAANAITALTVYDFSKAIIVLSIDFGIIILTSTLYFIYHLISNKTTKIVVNNLQEYVYNNVRRNTTLKKIDSSILSNIWECAEFNRNFLYKICFLIKSIILLCILIYFKLLMAGIILIVSLISFLLLRITNSKIQSEDIDLDISKKKSLELFNNIQQGIAQENNSLLEKSLKDKYIANINNSVKINNKISLFYNINNNFISLILKSAVFGLTIYLITLIKTTALTLSLYLILTPYLTSSAETLIAFFELIPEIGIIDNDLKEFEALKFQAELSKPKDISVSTYNLHFSNASFESQKGPTIKNLDLYINQSSSILFFGEEDCGKRAIFTMLTRKEKPTSGSILLDNKNIYDFSESQYNKLIYLTTKNPYFYKMSIFENLYLVCENRNKISKALKQFGLKSEIEKLRDGINTTIDESFSPELLFFLGIVRAYLSDARIICIYGLISNLNTSGKNHLNRILNILKSHCTLIIFSYSDELEIKFDKKIFIDNSIIKEIKSAKSSKNH